MTLMGQAYQQWMNEWDIEVSSDELPDPKLDGDLRSADASQLVFTPN